MASWPVNDSGYSLAQNKSLKFSNPLIRLTKALLRAESKARSRGIEVMGVDVSEVEDGSTSFVVMMVGFGMEVTSCCLFK